MIARLLDETGTIRREWVTDDIERARDTVRNCPTGWRVDIIPQLKGCIRLPVEALNVREADDQG